MRERYTEEERALLVDYVKGQGDTGKTLGQVVGAPAGLLAWHLSDASIWFALVFLPAGVAVFGFLGELVGSSLAAWSFVRLGRRGRRAMTRNKR